MASYDRALAVRPAYPLALVNRGNALRDLGRHHQALSCFSARSSFVAGGIPEALHNRGIALQDLGQWPGVVATTAALRCPPAMPRR